MYVNTKMLGTVLKQLFYPNSRCVSVHLSLMRRESFETGRIGWCVVRGTPHIARPSSNLWSCLKVYMWVNIYENDGWAHHQWVWLMIWGRNGSIFRFLIAMLFPSIQGVIPWSIIRFEKGSVLCPLPTQQPHFFPSYPKICHPIVIEPWVVLAFSTPILSSFILAVHRHL